MAQASILIIEPEAAMAHLFAQVWEEDGYTVACATSQDEARALFAAHGPDAFGMVLSYDLADQGPTPYAWLDRLRAWTRAPIVICTRSSATLYADHQARGYAAVVEEPSDLQEVLDAVATLSSGGALGAIRHAWQPGAQRAGYRAQAELRTRTGRTPGEAPDRATAALLAELALAGFPVDRLSALSTRPYRDALPILVRWLPRVRDGATKWALVSALVVPWARPLAAPALIDEFRQTPDDPCGLKWAIGYALTVVADDSVFADIVALLRDRGHGRARAIVVGALKRMRRAEARHVLLELLEDPDLEVVAEALAVLGALKVAGTQPQIVPFLTHPHGAVRGAAQYALATINRAVRVAPSGADSRHAKE